MTYTYECKDCLFRWEDRLPYEDRDRPCSEACPSCLIKDRTVRTFRSAPRISYNGSQTILQRAGSGWNDVLNKIKKASGKNNIETR
jgi:hypothetical protein